MDTHDWRTQLLPHTRQIKVNEIMSKLKMCHSVGGDDESLDVQKFSESFEQKTYADAKSEKISSMMWLIGSYDWRAQLQPDSRQRIVNEITETLRRHLPFAGQDGLGELRVIAARFEEKIYNTATSQSDYVRKICLKMLSMESGGRNTMANSIPSNSGNNWDRPSYTGSVRRAQVIEGQLAPNNAGRQSIRERRQPQWVADFVTYQ